MPKQHWDAERYGSHIEKPLGGSSNDKPRAGRRVMFTDDLEESDTAIYDHRFPEISPSHNPSSMHKPVSRWADVASTWPTPAQSAVQRSSTIPTFALQNKWSHHHCVPSKKTPVGTAHPKKTPQDDHGSGHDFTPELLVPAHGSPKQEMYNVFATPHDRPPSGQQPQSSQKSHLSTRTYKCRICLETFDSKVLLKQVSFSSLEGD